MKPVQSFVVIILLVSGVLVGVQAFLVIRALGRIPHDQKAFVRLNEGAVLKVLFAGDSTAVGTGSGDPLESVAGWFSRDFPEARIEQLSANGRKLGELDALFELGDRRYDLIVLQIGANDVMKFTPLSQSRRHIQSLVRKAKAHSPLVVILHSGNIGLAPVFSWPFNRILSHRTRELREVYQRVAQEQGALYVDLFREYREDVFLKDPHRYYAADMLHPSGQGYRWWYERIRATLEGAGVSLAAKEG